MHFRRKHERGKHTRENSSDWRYIQTDRSNKARSRPSIRRWAEKANRSLKDWATNLTAE